MAGSGQNSDQTALAGWESVCAFLGPWTLGLGPIVQGSLMSEPKPPAATSDDILAAVYSLIAVVEALEEWHRADEPLEGYVPETEPGDGSEKADVA